MASNLCRDSMPINIFYKLQKGPLAAFLRAVGRSPYVAGAGHALVELEGLWLFCAVCMCRTSRWPD